MHNHYNWPYPTNLSKTSKLTSCHESELAEAESMVRNVLFNSKIQPQDGEFDDFYKEIVSHRAAMASISSGAREYVYEAAENIFLSFGYVL
jgi:hypothetical protein